MNRYRVRITRHGDFIVEAETGREAIEVARKMGENTPGKMVSYRFTESKNPRVEMVKE